jgi:hypothetical protein
MEMYFASLKTWDCSVRLLEQEIILLPSRLSISVLL